MPDYQKAVDFSDGAGVSAFRLQYIPLYSKRSCLGSIVKDSQTEVESMKIIRYDKLVRDRIPEIIRASGKSCTTEVLSDEAYLRMIDAKLDEELAEYHQEQNLEELADLLEVLRAAVVARGYTLDELESLRAQKAAKRGGFAQKILLKEVIGGE